MSSGMSSEEFRHSVEKLAGRISETIEEFFGERFDWEAMRAQGSQDLIQLATDAHMFGADLWVTPH